MPMLVRNENACASKQDKRKIKFFRALLLLFLINCIRCLVVQLLLISNTNLKLRSLTTYK